MKLNGNRSNTGDIMIAVIFEFEPDPNHRQDYLDTAAELRAHLDEIDGFISIERFQSLNDENRILSLSFWRDEEAVKQWRNTAVHRNAQAKGRARLFKDYRLRVAGVVRDYSMTNRAEAPEDSLAAHGG